nr:EAL domain-containing protein [Treponemataceae bacterium]
VCRFIKTETPYKYGVEKINVNLSVVQCMNREFSEKIITIADNWKIPHEYINLEITETASIQYFQTLKANMEEFVSKGIDLSLDDYGSGLANLNYLLKLPFRKIKIDKEIVWQAFREEKAMIALKSTAAMIKALGLYVLAEGCETEEQKKILTEMGFDYLQGYLFSKPVPASDFIEIVKKEIEENPQNHKDLVKKEEAEFSQAENIEELEELEEFEDLEELEEASDSDY